jgi:hypothetical protein
MLKRIAGWPGLVFALVFAWKIALLVFSAQPVPANDSFYFDGPVVNLLLYGKYANPSIALAFPISGKEVFCGYPPVYQLLLLPWMAVFGTSVLASMYFHLVVFGCYLWVLLAIMRRLNLPRWCLALGGAFSLIITFDDRPDTLASLFGLLGVYAWVRSLAQPLSPPLPPPLPPRPIAQRQTWLWVMAGFVLLSFCTGLQIGAIYSFLVWIGALGTSYLRGERFPFAVLLTLFAVQVGLLLLVAVGFPHLWAGFIETGRQAPSVAGWRIPRPFELLRVARTDPGLLVVIAFLPWLLARREQCRQAGCDKLWLVTVTCALTGTCIVGAALLFLADSAAWFASYLQPLIVGGYLAAAAVLLGPARHAVLRRQSILFVALAAIGSVRAIGMSTWGLACAADVGYPAALERVGQELRNSESGQPVALSAAYLYEASRPLSWHDRINCLHCNWLGRSEAHRPNAMRDALVNVKPARLILTQLDYYFFYDPILTELKSRPDLVEFRIVNSSRLPTPDSFRLVRKFIQQVSWAPVVVELKWKEPGEKAK